LNKKRWGHNHWWGSHWTEDNERVLNYLQNVTGETPHKVDPGKGFDYQCGDVSVEVKSCKEKIKYTKKGSNGTQRKGLFHFHGHERSNFILYVLVREGGELEMSLLPTGAIDNRIGKDKCRITWSKVFTQLDGG